MKKMFKIFARTVAAALICANLAQTAWAASNDNKMVLKNLFYRTDFIANIEMPNYQGKQLTEEHVTMLEKIGCNLDVEAITKNNVSIKPIVAVGDRNFAYVVWEITAINGRKLDGDHYAFDNMDRAYQLRQMEAENYDAFSTVTVSGNPPSSYGFGSLIKTLKDENPNDNKLWLLTTVDETYVNINLTGQTLNFHITNFSEHLGSESGGGYRTVAKGPWDFSFLLDYEDSTKKTIGSETVQKRLGSSSETMRINSVEISPLSILIKGSKKEIDRDHFPITLKKKDGTTQNIEIYVGYTNGYSGQAGSSATARNFYAKHFFEEPFDVDEVVSVIIGGTELPLE